MQKYEKSTPEGDTFAQTRKITFGRFLHFTLLLSAFYSLPTPNRKEGRVHTHTRKQILLVYLIINWTFANSEEFVLHKFSRFYCWLKVIH